MLTLILSLNQSNYATGDRVVAKVSLKNAASTPQVVNTRFTLNSLSVSGNLREIGFRVRDSQDKALAFGAQVNVGSPTDAHFGELAPGESVEREYDLSQYYAFNKPDMYALKAIYQNGSDPSNAPAWKGRVESDAVKIVVNG